MTSTQLQEGLDYTKANFEGINKFSKIDKQLISHHFNLVGKDVLDFGCGMGHMSVWFSKALGANVEGVDLDENHIIVAEAFNKKIQASNVKFFNRNIITSPINKQYDFIFLNDVVEHIQVNLLQKILDILILKNLKTGGIIFFSYPPWQGPHASHLRQITKIPWVQFFPKKFIINLVNKNNIQLVGKNTLAEDYAGLNHMTHNKLVRLLQKHPVEMLFRKSYTKLNRIRYFKNVNLNFFPFKFFVTKEFIAFKKKS